MGDTTASTDTGIGASMNTDTTNNQGLASILFEYCDIPIGANADLAELLYISALLQSDENELRKDGSVTVEDWATYLISRHGIDLFPSLEDFQKVLVKDLHAHSHNDRLDLVQMVAMLFITPLCKCYRKNEAEEAAKAKAALSSSSESSHHLDAKLEDNKDDVGKEDFIHADSSIIGKVLGMILHDVTGKAFQLSSREQHLDKVEVPLTKELIMEVLAKYGEINMSRDDALIDEMMNTANAVIKGEIDGEDYDKSVLMLNTKTFLKLLTADCIESINVNSDVNYSTNFTDVFDDCGCGKSIALQKLHESMKVKAGNNNEVQSPLQYKVVHKSDSIDYVAGNYSCRYTVMVVWIALYFSYVGYILPVINERTRELISTVCDIDYEPLSLFSDNISVFQCDILLSIIDWLARTMIISGIGCLFIYLTGLGFEIDNDVFTPQLLSTLILSSVFILFIGLVGFDTKDPVLLYNQLVFLVSLGVALFYRWGGIVQLVNKACCESIHHPSIIQERSLKMSSSTKLNLLQKNAISIHSDIGKKSVIKAYFGQGVHNFAKNIDKTESIGGLSWGLKFMFKPFNDYGVWVSAKLEAAFLSQLLATVIILCFGISFTRHAYDVWEPSDVVGTKAADSLRTFFTDLSDLAIVQNATENVVRVTVDIASDILEIFDSAGLIQFDCLTLSSYLVETCSSGITSGATDFLCSLFSGSSEDVCVTLEPLSRPMAYSAVERPLVASNIFNTTSLFDRIHDIIDFAVYDNVVSIVSTWYPQERYMIWVPCLVCSIFSLLIACCLSLCAYPNTVVLTLKFRSGVVPTLLDPVMLIKYRQWSSFSSRIMSFLFWGCILGSLTTGAVGGGLLFLCFWQVTSFYMQQIIALLVGITAAILMRISIQRPGELYCWKSFYRKRPFVANWLHVINECIALALSIYMAVGRLFTLFFLSILFIGRIDKPFIDKSNHLIVSESESHYPIFISSLLTSEAHRHPYIEALGTSLLYKLRHGPRFMNRAGCTWRLVFTLALMPWLQKYRMLTHENSMRDEKYSTVSSAVAGDQVK